MKSRLEFIAKSENCQVEPEQIDSILLLAEGDMRRAVTTLQSVHALGKAIDADALAELAGLPPAKVVNDLWSSMKTNRFDTMREAVEDVIASGYSAQTILGTLSQKILEAPDDELDELGRASLSIRIAEAEKNMIDGADEYLQLMTVCGLGLACLDKKTWRTAIQ
jgi:replication factor C subunit 2/4